MKKTIGGDRLGAGKKMQVALHNYERSTHNLSRDWRSTMSCGPLTPCFVDVALNGDTWDIDIHSLIKTQPTNLPTFGSFKFQVDVFECPIRLYNGLLHNNMQRIGMDMSKVILPTIEFPIPNEKAGDNENVKQFSNDSLMYYLGVKGIGLRNKNVSIQTQSRKFNAVPLLAYYDIFKNYYANKQEEYAYVIDTKMGDVVEENNITQHALLNSDFYKTNTSANGNRVVTKMVGCDGYVEDTWEETNKITTRIPYNGKLIVTIKAISGNEYLWLLQKEYNMSVISSAREILIENDSSGTNLVFLLRKNENNIEYEIELGKFLQETYPVTDGFEIILDFVNLQEGYTPENQQIEPTLTAFPLENLDQMRIDILRKTGLGQAINITDTTIAPYGINAQKMNGIYQNKYKPYSPQAGLCVKTYQSDIFNNWLSSEWIEGANGIAEITAIDTSSGSFTMDTLNLSQKVYNMLNRIAVSGGSYEDWQEAVYGEDAIRRAESPIYCGGMSCEIAFEEVVSSATSGDQPLGTLGGKGKALGHKGGNITIKVKEPSFIIAIASITPRIDYYDGNKWFMTELKTMNDLHKPALDGIGFQNLMSEQMAWWTYNPQTDSSRAIGKIPAWLNYMTAVNETYGKFAGNGTEEFNESAMVINRSYDKMLENGNYEIADATTYIDPKKYNYLWAVDDLTSQYFYVQLGFNTIVRRKMSAKVIPNL